MSFDDDADDNSAENTDTTDIYIPVRHRRRNQTAWAMGWQRRAHEASVEALETAWRSVVSKWSDPTSRYSTSERGWSAACPLCAFLFTFHSLGWSLVARITTRSIHCCEIHADSFRFPFAL